jgi:alpha-mannosidase
LPAARDANETPAVVNTIENEFFKLTFNLKSGEITSLFDKTLQAELLAGPANVISRQVDNGDLWEPYHALDGGMSIAATNQQPVPTSANAILSNAFSDKHGAIRRGPVFSEFTVAHPLANGHFATRVRVGQGLRRIDIETTLVNNEKHVRYQALFPTTIKDGRYTQEIPFGAVERPIGVENPAQNWVDYSDGQRGLAVLNIGLAGNLVNDGTLMLSLLRSVDLIGYNEGRPSLSGFQLGIPRTFRYALVPHAGGWRQAPAFRHGQEFNSPLIVRKVAPHAGDLPKSKSMVEISNPNVVLTALKPGPAKSVIVRVYEATGQPAKAVKLKFGAKLARAKAANLLEDTDNDLPVEDDAVQFDLRPFEIKTISLSLAAR